MWGQPAYEAWALGREHVKSWRQLSEIERRLWHTIAGAAVSAEREANRRMQAEMSAMLPSRWKKDAASA